jgi:hypothetical protein
MRGGILGTHDYASRTRGQYRGTSIVRREIAGRLQGKSLLLQEKLEKLIDDFI